MSHQSILPHTLLPFKKEILEKYFYGDIDQQIKYYTDSIEKYKKYEAGQVERKFFKSYRQAEKDERFYTARYFINLFEKIENGDRDIFLKFIKLAFSNDTAFTSISKLLEDGDCKPKLILEHQLPAPKEYKKALSDNLLTNHLVDYIRDWGVKNGVVRTDLEGATHVDAYIECKDKFKIIIEAKYLSDISYQVTYDMSRNQIARNIDCMLEDRTLQNYFVLITPKNFKDNPKTRMYGYKMKEYLSDYTFIKEDLKHRTDLTEEEWKELPERLAWITWSDLEGLCL